MSPLPLSLSQNRILPYELLPLQSDKKKKTILLKDQPIIQDVAKRCFIELAASLAIGSAAALFTATPLHATVIFACIAIQTICNGALRIAHQLAARSEATDETKKIQASADYLAPTMFSYLTAWNGQSLIHEAGHAIAAACLFQNATPQITLTPCLGGITRFSTAALTPLGEKVGKNGALLITTLMGPATSLLVSAIALSVGYAVREKFPELSRYLLCVALGDFYTHALYAATAFPSASTGTVTHDFIRLKSYGIHPLLSAITILAIPILIARCFHSRALPSISHQRALGPLETQKDCGLQGSRAPLLGV